jgi:hypothetical protein
MMPHPRRTFVVFLNGGLSPTMETNDTIQTRQAGRRYRKRIEQFLAMAVRNNEMLRWVTDGILVSLGYRRHDRPVNYPRAEAIDGSSSRADARSPPASSQNSGPAHF